MAPGATVITVKPYNTNSIRAFAAARGGWANMPGRTTRKGTFSISRRIYRQRNRVECFFNRLKQCRGLATRYDRRPDTFLAAIKLAAVCS